MPVGPAASQAAVTWRCPIRTTALSTAARKRAAFAPAEGTCATAFQLASTWSPTKLCTAALVWRAAACTASTNAVAHCAAIGRSPVTRSTRNPIRARTTVSVRIVSAGAWAAGRCDDRRRCEFPLPAERWLRPDTTSERLSKLVLGSSAVSVSFSDALPLLLAHAAALTSQFGRCGRYASRFSTIASSASDNSASATSANRNASRALAVS
mmetsp:Transcript_7502/g.23424  ORF Transcript_7502/g.23424 Transcript_7502/m.23424 type:complete len:210 (-) Transcript_7502:222-851(-)